MSSVTTRILHTIKAWTSEHFVSNTRGLFQIHVHMDREKIQDIQTKNALHNEIVSCCFGYLSKQLHNFLNKILKEYRHIEIYRIKDESTGINRECVWYLL